MSHKITDFNAVLAGKADQEQQERVESLLKDPNNDLFRSLEGMNADIGEPITWIEWLTTYFKIAIDRLWEYKAQIIWRAAIIVGTLLLLPFLFLYFDWTNRTRPSNLMKIGTKRPSLELILPKSRVSIAQGDSQELAVRISRRHFEGAVDLRFHPKLPKSIRLFGQLTIPKGKTATTTYLRVDANAEAAKNYFSVVASNRRIGINDSKQFTLEIVESQANKKLRQETWVEKTEKQLLMTTTNIMQTEKAMSQATVRFKIGFHNELATLNAHLYKSQLKTASLRGAHFNEWEKKRGNLSQAIIQLSQDVHEATMKLSRHLEKLKLKQASIAGDVN